MDNMDWKIYRNKIDEEKTKFMQFGQLPDGFQFIQGHMGRLGSPAAVAATGAMPIGGGAGGVGRESGGRVNLDLPGRSCGVFRGLE